MHWNSGGVKLLQSTGLPLGMFREASFASARLRMCGGDLLFLYTDGLSEAPGNDGEYGVDRVADLIGRHEPCCAAAIISACLEDVRSFAGANPGLDDLTLLAIRHDALAGGDFRHGYIFRDNILYTRKNAWRGP
ncbi:MAG: PP2C family protein-serine/threonine phosphatase [Terracidiphilus sp.]